MDDYEGRRFERKGDTFDQTLRRLVRKDLIRPKKKGMKKPKIEIQMDILSSGPLCLFWNRGEKQGSINV